MEGLTLCFLNYNRNQAAMLIHSADFVISNTDIKLCPKPDRPEYAFIGRSNVGKSSIINMLTGRTKLAKVSGTPGKTVTINHFVINEKEGTKEKGWFLADLPGYGFAKRSKKQRAEFELFIHKYMLERRNLQCVLLLVDSRIDPQKIDLEFANFLGENGVPFVLVYTKVDKNKLYETNKNIKKFEAAMLETWENLPKSFRSSSKTKEGREDILGFIDEINRNFVI